MPTIISRNIVDNDTVTLSPVTDFSIFTGFSCGLSDLDEFIQNDAKGHAEQLLAVTYVLYLKDSEGTILPAAAFASVQNDSVEITTTQKKKLFRRVKHYSAYPALKIGRLGVRTEFQRHGVGTQLLDVVKKLFLFENRTGCRYITVDAYNTPETLAFYKKNEFEFLTPKDVDKKTRHMYFDLYRLLAKMKEDSCPS